MSRNMNHQSNASKTASTINPTHNVCGKFHPLYRNSQRQFTGMKKEGLSLCKFHLLHQIIRHSEASVVLAKIYEWRGDVAKDAESITESEVNRH